MEVSSRLQLSTLLLCGVLSLLLQVESFRSHIVAPRQISRLKMAGFDTVVSVSSTFEQPCTQQSDPGITLTDYMKLPVDQYVCIKMPLDASLERMAGTRFNMTVPPVSFFNLDLSPTILCDVTQCDDSIKIVSTECILRGSPYVEGLNGCFKMKINSEFRWSDSAEKRAISSASDIYVEVDPPPPFKYIARTILEKTGHIAMSIALAQIENAFVKSLARDYEKWANDAEYRTIRAGGGCELQDTKYCMTPSGTAAAAFANAEEVEDDQFAGAEIDIPVETVVTKESPAVLLDDVCLLPGGEPIIRVEVAPSNSRRIFTGVDIMAGMDAVWDVLTAYEKLQDVVPSLVKNEVVERTPNGGARLAQVGGAKVLPGVTFTAKTILDVRVYREDNPLPDNMLAEHLPDNAPSKAVREYDMALPLRRGIFPRPFSYTTLPHRDITMQNVLGEGDFEHYQGVWRIQSLPNCNPNGEAARLTYAVELKPKGILPVRLIEGRIASDLKANMAAIRDFVEAKEQVIQKQRKEATAAAATTTRKITPGIKRIEGVLLRGDLSLLEAINRGVASVTDPQEQRMQEAADILSSATTSSPTTSPSPSSSLLSNSIATATETLPTITDVAVVPVDEKKRVASDTSYTGLYVRRNVRAALSSLFSQKEIVSIDSTDTDSNSPDQMTVEQLLDQNNLLKSRIAFLEAEMDKAKNILMQVESLDDDDEWR